MRFTAVVTSIQLRHPETTQAEGQLAQIVAVSEEGATITFHVLASQTPRVGDRFEVEVTKRPSVMPALRLP